MSRQFWANVASVLSGTAIAQAIPVLGSLVLARLFVPEAYGGYAVWLGVVLIVAVVLSLRLDMALAVIPDGEEREQALGYVLVTIALWGLVAVAIAAGLAMTGLAPSGLGTPWLLAAAVFGAVLAAWLDTWQAMAAADGAYRLLVRLRIAQTSLILACQLGASLLSRSAEALVAGHVAGMACMVLVALVVRRPQLPLHAGLGSRLVAFWRSHPRFPVFALPADAINSVSAQLPLLIVSARFGNESAGALALTMRVLGTPIGLLGRALLDVFRRHAAEACRQRGECRAEYLSTLKVLAAASAVFAIATMFLAEPLFVFAFGEAWRLAGALAVLMIPLFALRFVASPLSYVFYIVGKQNVDLIWQICLLAVISVALLVPADVRGSVIAYALGYSTMYVVYLALSFRFSQGSAR